MDKSEKIRYFDSVAEERVKWRKKGAYYHRELERYLQFLIPPSSSVLEIGCGTGELLASLNPSRGLGIDVSPKMVEVAKRNFPTLEFQVADMEDLKIDETFDYVLVMEVIGYVDDIQNAFEQLRKVCRPNTRVIIDYFNYLWEPILKFSETVGLRMKRPLQHWLPSEDIENLLRLNDFEVIKKRCRFLCPIYIPFISAFFNKFLANMPFFWRLSLNEIIVARMPGIRKDLNEVTCSIVIPCRNERGNIEKAVKGVPEMGKQTEFIFVEGHSQDGTIEECYRVQRAYPDKDIKVIVQDGIGKGDAIRKGFSQAKGDILMILDADLAVAPEDLPKFFEAITSGKGEFINGSRLVYQMERQAMRRLNLLGNKFFSLAFTYLLEQRLRDTLCGTKVLWSADYEKITAGRDYFGNFDPFGDFDLLFGAAKINLKIVEIPIKYRERTYGSTQIDRFRHGWLLIKMVFFALRKIKIK